MNTMHREKEDINYVSLLLITFINGLFCYKYSLRITEFASLVTFIYCALFFALPFIARFLPDRFANPTLIYVLILLYALVNIIYLKNTDPRSLNVDRWSVITSFWDALLSYTFPYLAKSHMGNPPGPFPFYFVIAFPFYLVGEIGYLSLSGVILLLCFITKHFTHKKVWLILTILLVISTALIWEVTVRSANLINVSLILFYIAWLKKQVESEKSLIIPGIIGGLLLSTRAIVIIPISVCWAFYFLRERKWNQFFTIAIFSALGFIFTLLPFLLWDYHLFMQYNPVTLQSSFVPLPITALFVIGSFAAGFFVKNQRELFFYSGLLIFGVVSIYFTYKVNELGFTMAYIKSQADISYFILSLPFLFVSLYVSHDKKIK